MNKLPSYSRRIPEFKKRVVRMKWQVKYLPSWWPKVKDKPVVISEGDSWFDFPLKSLAEYFGFALKKLIGLQGFAIDDKTNIIDYLADNKKLDMQLLRIERSGDISSELTAKTPDQRGGVKEKDYPSNTLTMVLKEKNIAKHVDFILLSAGGNDMVNHAQKHSIQDYQTDWRSSCDIPTLKAEAQLITDNFVEALMIRDQYAPQACVVTHSYCNAIHTCIGTPLNFDLQGLTKLLDFLLPKFGIDWLMPVLKTLGVNMEGEYTIDSEAHLHKIFDKHHWPKNQGDAVHPERQAFIQVMLTILHDTMQDIPKKYQAKTGQVLRKFELINISNECQSPEFWADYIHLNSDGYKVVAKHFQNRMEDVMAGKHTDHSQEQNHSAAA